MHGGAKGFS